jgi:hypothetical protein
MAYYTSSTSYNPNSHNYAKIPDAPDDLFKDDAADEMNKTDELE